MTDKRVKIPGGMFNHVRNQSETIGVQTPTVIVPLLCATLEWLMANPIIPTDEQVTEAGIKSTGTYPNQSSKMEGFRLGVHWALEFQSRMFLSGPEIPERIQNLMWGDWHEGQGVMRHNSEFDPISSHNNQVLEAYRRGLEDKEGK